MNEYSSVAAYATSTQILAEPHMQLRPDMARSNWTSTCFCYRNIGIQIKD
jgi:hypothetical protein